MSHIQGKIVTVYLVLALAFTVIASLSYAAPPDLTNRLAGRLRGGYMGYWNFKLLPKMSQNGMNAAIARFDSSVPLSNSDAAMLRKWADECKRLNLAFMPVFDWWGYNEASWLKDYNRVVTENGEILERTPCPYTQDFWDRCITPRFVAISRVLREREIAAILLDMEMYGAEFRDNRRGCYCDVCFTRYMQAKGHSGELPVPAGRGKIINQANELGAYQALQREAARTFAVACRMAVHKVHPGLRLGALHLDQPIPVQQGLALGFGTPDLPVFCLTERTYSNGYTPYIDSAQKSFRNMGAFVDLLVGIWQSKFPPEDIAAQLYHCAHDSYGYWVYTMQTFEKLDYHPLIGMPQEYWEAIHKANSELDKLGRNGNYQTVLQVRRVEPLHNSPP